MTAKIYIETDDIEGLKRLLNLAGIDKEMTAEATADVNPVGEFSPIKGPDQEYDLDQEYKDTIEINRPLFPIDENEKPEDSMEKEIARDAEDFIDSGDDEIDVEDHGKLDQLQEDFDDEVYGFWEAAFKEANSKEEADLKTIEHLMNDHKLTHQQAIDKLYDITCRNCHGEGCADCNETGKVRLVSEQNNYDYGHRTLSGKGTPDDDNINYAHIYKDPKLGQRVTTARFGSNPFDEESADTDVQRESEEFDESNLLIENLDENNYRKLDEIATLVGFNDKSLFSGLYKVKAGMFESINKSEKNSLAIAFINLLENDDANRLGAVHSVFQSLKEKSLDEAYRQYLEGTEIDKTDYVKEHGYDPEKVYETKNWAFNLGKDTYFFEGFYMDVKGEVLEFAENKKFLGTIKLQP